MQAITEVMGSLVEGGRARQAKAGLKLNTVQSQSVSLEFVTEDS